MITKNLLPKSVKGQDTQQAKPNSWAKMDKEEQFIDSIDTSGLLRVWRKSALWLCANADSDACVDCDVQLRAKRYPAPW